MIYRIDIQHFLTHAIDHFTMQELTHFQYAIISAKVRNQSRVLNVSKFNVLYPTPEIVTAYADYQDKKILEKMYMEMLDSEDSATGTKWAANRLYTIFVKPLLDNVDVVIICDRLENDYIDVLCKYLKKRFDVEVIDLNELFSKGRIGSIYIDRNVIRDKAVDVRRAAAKEMKMSLESTSDGRLHLLNQMDKKEKIDKLKELGINVTKSDKNDLDKLLIDEWVQDDYQELD